uniref:DNA excision repair protein ERCC-1-like n=1 Tax=Myxine glutinosa TaxID=7769 RepID=UPI00358FD378
MEGNGNKRKLEIPNVGELAQSPSQPKRLFKPTRLRSEPDVHEAEPVTGKAYADYVIQQCFKTEGQAVAPPLPNEGVGGRSSLEDRAVTKSDIKDVPMDGPTCQGTDPLSEVPGTSEVPATSGLGQNASHGPCGVIARAVGKTNSLLVNPRQRGNPVLKHFRNVPWEFSDIVPDYVMGQTSCTLFLSLRYHHLNPDYIYERLRMLGTAFDLRVLLVQVDVKDPHRTLKELAKMCVLADCTLILAWRTRARWLNPQPA